jgi:hypothetical protein
MSLPRKVITLCILALTFALGTTVAGAAPGKASHEIIRETVTWTLPAGQCPALPADLEVNGVGERHLIIHTINKSDGSTQLVFSDVVRGTATDNWGGSYRFVYSNHSVERYPAGPGPIAIQMTDNFVMNGSGAADKLHVGFNWSWTFTPPAELFPPVDNWVQHSTRGEPLLCDPI